MNRTHVVEFFKSGRLGSYTAGTLIAAVWEEAGDPDATTGSLPAMHAYGDLQLGFSKHGVLWYLALEPSGSDLVLPGPRGARETVQNFTRTEFVDGAEVGGEVTVRSESFVSGEYWWSISGSSVFVEFDEEGLMAVAQYAERRLAN
ncbi:hypothetical protein [Amycolatopsis sp. NPDC001319]|uniref:hypothetical protein n=1 Tax=unclassified Amycolatopsis TaxID=2618356 RepID=UPI0036A3EDAB